MRLIFKTYPLQLVISGICVALGAFATVAGSFFLRRLVDNYITPMLRERVPNFAPLIHALIIMGIIFLIGVVAVFLSTEIMAIVSQQLQRDIRNQLFQHMEKLPMRFFDSTDDGDTMSRYTNDVDTLRQLVSQSFPQLISAGLNWLFALAAMLILSWQMSMVSIGIFILSLFLVRWMTNESHKYFQGQQQAIGQIDSYVEETLTGQKEVKVFSHEAEVEHQFIQLNDAWGKAAAKANGYATMLFPMMGNIGNFLYVLVAVAGGFIAINRIAPLTLGTIAAFVQLSRSFSQPVAQISQQLNFIVQAMAGAERIFQLLDEPVEVDNGTITLVHVTQDPQGNLHETTDETPELAWKTPTASGTPKLTRLRGDITFDHVNFSYDGVHQTLFDISFQANQGQQVALVGETGAGKTTITNMLNRFYEIESGTITYDGINIVTIKKADLRRAMAIVLQQTNLFTDTVAGNIRYGRLSASTADVVNAAKLADADAFITQLPQQYETEIDGSNSNLSEGQRQLLSIARAAVADPPVMILDEATSNVDTNTERQIQGGMDNLMKNRTTLAIAHRLSTVFNSDLILVISAGRIIERGTHDQLMAEHGKYYELYTGKIDLK
nr:ABC transporter ATP-binding protein [Levilactobacillus bambusae]